MTLGKIHLITVPGPCDKTVKILFGAQVHLPYMADLIRCISAINECHLVTTERQLVYLDAAEWRRIIPETVPATIENDLPDGKKLSAFHHLRAAMQLRRLVNRLRPEVLHLQESFEAKRVVSWMQFLSGLKCPLVLTVHDPVPNPGDVDKTWRLKQGIQTKLRERADRILATSNRNRATILGLHPRMDPFRVGVVPHHALTYYCRYSPPQATQVRGRLLFFGRMVDYKGIDTLADAWPIIRKSREDATLTIAGSGSALIPHIGSFENDSRVTIMNSHVPNEEAAKLFCESELVLLPYKGASQSGVIGTALAFGKACVASNVGSIPEVLVDGDSGVLIPPGDPTALAEAVLELLRDPERRAQIERGAARLAAGELSPESISATLEDELRLALHPR